MRFSRVFAALFLLLGLLTPISCSRTKQDAGIELEFWTIALASFRPYIESQLRGFEAANPGVRVRWVDVPYNVLERKLIAAAAAGRAPDVVNMSDINYSRFASLGAFIDMEPLAARFTRETADERYLAGALALCRIDVGSESESPLTTEPGNSAGDGRRKLLALPWYVNPQTSIINESLLAEGGLTTATLARDWRGLLAQAPEFFRRTGAHLISQPLGEESQLPIMLLSEGLSPLKPRDPADPRAGLAPDLRRQEVRDYIALWVEAFRSGWLPRDAGTTGHSHLLTLYQERRLAVISTGPNLIRTIRDVSRKAYETTTVREGVVGALGRAHMPIMVLSVTSQSRHPELATKLAWWMTSPEAQLEFCKIVPILPSTRASVEDPFFRPSQDEMSGPDGVLVRARSVAAESLATATGFTAALDCWPDLRRSFEEGMKRILLDDRDLDEGLRDIESEWDRILLEATPGTMDAIPRPEPVRRRAE